MFCNTLDCPNFVSCGYWYCSKCRPQHKCARHHVVIVGAGPIGVEAAVKWFSAGPSDVTVTLLEEGKGAGANVRKWGHVRLFSPWKLNTSSWGQGLLQTHNPKAWDAIAAHQEDFATGDEHVRGYLEPLLDILQQFPDRVSIRYSTRVTTIAKRTLNKDEELGEDSRANDQFRLLCVNTRTGGEEEVYGDVVIDASGCYSIPRNFGSGGIPALNENRLSQSTNLINYYVPNVQAEFAGKSTLVIGSGYSAITTVNNLLALQQTQPNTEIFWFTRKQNKNGHGGVYTAIQDDVLPQRKTLCELGNKLVEEAGSAANPRVKHRVVKIISKVEEIHGRVRVHYYASGADVPSVLEVDRVVSNCGYRPDMSIARELQVHYCWASDGPMNLAASLLGASGDCLAQVGAGADLLRNPEPNFFILGGKSYGRNSSFLMKLGVDQVGTVFDFLASKSQL